MARVRDRQKSLLQIMLVYRKLSRQKAQRRRRQNLFMLFSTLHCLRMKAIQNQRNAILSSLSLSKRKRRYWMMYYNQLYFETLWNQRRNDVVKEIWKRDYRMSVETFEEILNMTNLALRCDDTNMRRAVPVEKRLAIFLWRLATGNSYRSIGKLFGVGKSTVIKIFRQGIASIIPLANNFIKFPKTTFETSEAMKRFQEFTECKIPQVVGAIDGTHIEIMAPSTDSKADYYSRKQRYTINTQAIVGSNLIFLDVATGFPGSVHDARILRSSQVYAKSEAGEILIKPEKVINNENFRPLLLGDGAYPQTSWLIKPYANNIRLTHTQKKFNKELSSARVTVERGFGLLKGRWRCLLKRLDNDIENVTSIIISCFILHNILQINGDNYEDVDGLVAAIIREERIERAQRALHMGVALGNMRDILADFVSN